MRARHNPLIGMPILGEAAARARAISYLAASLEEGRASLFGVCLASTLTKAQRAERKRKNKQARKARRRNRRGR